MAGIKSSELSIGDWVRNCKGTNLRITEIPWNCIVTKHKGIEHALRFSSIHPIPLTPEILEKNGFRKNGNYNEWNLGEWDDIPFIGVSLDRQCIRIKHFGNDIYIEGKVVYVHQLQNALRLAGVGKEIEL